MTALLEQVKFVLYKLFFLPKLDESVGANKRESKSSPARLLVLLFLFICFLPFSLVILTYNYFASTKPKLYYKATPRNVSILKRCHLLQNTYHPSPFTLIPFGWLINLSGHIHTFLHEFVREVPNMMEFRRVLFQVDSDGGEVAIDHFVPLEDSKEAEMLHSKSPIMLIIHGVVGGSHSHYVRHYAKNLASNGIRPVVLNARGCSFSELKTPKYFTTHFTDDIRKVILYLKEVYPDCHLFASAYSLGANLLTKYLGEEGHSCPLVAAIAFANPFDWMVIDNHLRKPFERHFYNYILTRSLINYLNRHRNVFKNIDGIDIEDVDSITTLQEYDSKITCKLWGFESVHEYYSTSCGKDFLNNIKIPFLTLQALDDPIIPSSAIPYAEYLKNPNILLATTDHGGHIAWLEGFAPTGTTWADRVGAEFTKSILDHLKAVSVK